MFVDDDGDALLSMVRALKTEGISAAMHACSSPQAALKLSGEVNPQVVVLDLGLDEKRGVESGFELLAALQKRDPTCRIIVLTGHGGPRFGVRALSMGAASFLEKPADIMHLKELIRDGITQCELKRSYNAIAADDRSRLASMLTGSSSCMCELREGAAYAARTAQPVMITGETGSGKGVCALAIHRLSVRCARNFVKYQPGLGAADLVNSALFGHLKGAFTGAGESRAGLLLEAHGGSLFLDEVDELPAGTQVALLGALQEKRFRPVGSDVERESDFRLLCASNQDIEMCLESGKLRRDFYHRIAHLSLRMPALRERREDLPELAETILARLREKEGLNVFKVNEAAIRELQSRDWPGNVRELEAVLEHAAFKTSFSGRSVIETDDIKPLKHASAPQQSRDFHSQVASFKLKLIEEALRRHGGNQVRAADELKLDRSTMRRLLER